MSKIVIFALILASHNAFSHGHGSADASTCTDSFQDSHAGRSGCYASSATYDTSSSMCLIAYTCIDSSGVTHTGSISRSLSPR